MICVVLTKCREKGDDVKLSNFLSVKMFVFSKMQHFPNWLFNISTDMSKIRREGKRAEMENQKLSLFIYLLEI